MHLRVQRSQSTNPNGANYCFDIGPAPTVKVSQAAASILPLFPIPSGSGLEADGIDTVTVTTSPTVSENWGQIRVDHNFSASDSFFVRYTVDNGLLNTPSPMF